MGNASKIEWTGATWNPWQGCRKLSAGCQHCYMFREKRRYGQDPKHIHRSAKATFEAPLKWQRQVERGDRAGKGRLVFTCSWSDWFIEEADAWRDDAWAIVRECKDLVFQVLTKRIERARHHLPWTHFDEWKNVWIGTSIENQAAADLRVNHLLGTPAAVRFLSAEPLLGRIDLTRIATYEDGNKFYRDVLGKRDWHPDWECGESWFGPGIDWVIVGGESGEEARPMHPEWVRFLRYQCQEASVPMLFKQWGEWLPFVDADEIKHVPSDTPVCLAKMDGSVIRPYAHLDGPGHQMARVGKKVAGRTLDGRIHDEYPIALEVAS